MSAAQASNLISSTAGAIPVLNDKGELSMQKVKVHRYVSGRRPKYAPKESSDEESGDEFTFERRQQPAAPEPIPVDEEAERSDPRLRNFSSPKCTYGSHWKREWCPARAPKGRLLT
ncbi:hypothetical protein IscW_ISCW002617 [Ixodes scapularis]|uniref:Uncharacterized protein n=1 Tax=Ixodes scapularis TaxID=6945 RepID=B7PDP0_IXOSC|nr:hypothetical protein IscW_ISCW002617 [Ixodes scapularis]|eukprot:XP_002410984.1 hypothetical protein IscW_ISCW002617 [Ixodes scapularis]